MLLFPALRLLNLMRSTPTQINSTARTGYNLFRLKTLFIWLGFVLAIAVFTRTKSADTAMAPKSVLIVGKTLNSPFGSP